MATALCKDGDLAHIDLSLRSRFPFVRCFVLSRGLRLLDPILFPYGVHIVLKRTLLKVECFKRTAFLEPVIDLSCRHVRKLCQPLYDQFFVDIRLSGSMPGSFFLKNIRWLIPVLRNSFSVDVQHLGYTGFLKAFSFECLNFGVFHPINHPFITSGCHYIHPLELFI